MNTNLLIAGAVGAAIAVPAGAVGYHFLQGEPQPTGPQLAQIVQVVPIQKTVSHRTPHKKCWKQPVTTSREVTEGWSKNGRIATGAVVGGVAGNALGHGNGKPWGTVAGALIGGWIGNETADDATHNVQETHYVTRCKTTYTTEQSTRTEGYNVTYSYKGQLYSTRMQQRPTGTTIPVQVNIVPSS